MKKKTIYLHVGTTKTGSTSIQAVLKKHSELLSRKDFSVYTPKRSPRIGDPVQTRKFLKIMRGPAKKGSVEWIETFVDQIRLDPAGKIIFSEECLWELAGRRLNRPLFREFITALQSFSDVKLIVYLRRQDNYLMSAYQQRLRIGRMHGETCCQWAFSFGKMAGADYRDCLEWFLPIIGKDNVSVRVFESGQFVDGSLIQDFLQTVGLNVNDGFLETPSWRNPGLTPFLTELLRCLSASRHTHKLGGALFRELRDGKKESCFRKSGSHAFISPATRCKLIRKYEPGNRWIAKELLGREDGVLFSDPLPSPDKAWQEYRLDKADVRALLEEVDCLSPEQRTQVCRRVLHATRHKPNRLSHFGNMLACTSVRVLRELKARLMATSRGHNKKAC